MDSATCSSIATVPRTPVADYPPSLHGHACAGDGSSPSQTEAPIDATRVAMKPVLYSSAHEHACAGGCSPSQTDAPSSTTVAAMAPDSTQTEPELWVVLPISALQQHVPRPTTSVHLPSLTYTHPGSTSESCDSSTRSHVGRVPNSPITCDLHPRSMALWPMVSCVYIFDI